MKNKLSWGLRLVVAVILLQTLYFKFTGADESIWIFTTIGIEPWGRYLTGIAELIASVLILIPSTAWLGAMLSSALMAGALAMHALFLGIEVQNDSGLLFGLAVIVFLCSVFTLWLNRHKFPLMLIGILRYKN